MFTYLIPVKAANEVISGKTALPVPWTVKNHYFYLRQMRKELKCHRGILYGKIEMHLVVILKFKTEITVFDKAVPAIFVEAV